MSQDSEIEIFSQTMRAMMGHTLNDDRLKYKDSNHLTSFCSEMNLETLKSMICFVKLSAEEAIEDNKEIIQSALYTFWYVCDTVLDDDLLQSSACRIGLLDVIDTCLGIEIKMIKDNALIMGEKLLFLHSITQLSGLLSLLYGDIKKKVEIASSEERRYSNYLRTITQGVYHQNVDGVFVKKREFAICDIRGHLVTSVVNIVGVDVPIIPSSRVLSFLLKEGMRVDPNPPEDECPLEDLPGEAMRRTFEDPPITNFEAQQFLECAELVQKYANLSTRDYNKIIEEIQMHTVPGSRDYVSTPSSDSDVDPFEYDEKFDEFDVHI